MLDLYEGEYIHIYRPDLGNKVREAVIPGADGSYTVYIDRKLDKKAALEAYRHALRHIKNGDFDTDCCRDVQEIESRAHRKV